MRAKMKTPPAFQILLLCLLLTLLAACGPKPQMVGTYIAEINDSPNHNAASMELKENGVGIWKLGDEEVTFSWYVKNNEIRLNTKNGGVIVGNLDSDVIHVTLPGSKKLFFKRAK